MLFYCCAIIIIPLNVSPPHAPPVPLVSQGCRAPGLSASPPPKPPMGMRFETPRSRLRLQQAVCGPGPLIAVVITGLQSVQICALPRAPQTLQVSSDACAIDRSFSKNSRCCRSIKDFGGREGSFKAHHFPEVISPLRCSSVPSKIAT